MLSDNSIIVAAVVAALGLAWYQSIAVQGTPPKREDAGEVIRIDEVKELAAALAPAPVKVDDAANPAGHAPEVRGFPLARRGGFVAVPRATGKGAASRATPAKSTRVERAPATRKTSKESVFRRETSAMSRELSKNFYKKTDFGFSQRVKKSASGKRVSVQRS